MANPIIIPDNGLWSDIADSLNTNFETGVPTDNFAGGLFDYNDVGTTASPISVTGGAGFVDLTNDEAGAFTNKLFPPVGVTDVWNASNNEFDFSQLKLGDMVDIRLDLDVITASVNTEFQIALHLAIGGFDYFVNWFNAANFKNAATNKIVVYNGIYIGDTNTLNNTAKFVIQSDKDLTVVVNGWYCKVVTRG